MEIRSVTIGQDVALPAASGVFQRAGEFGRQAKSAIEAAGYPVQNLRLSTQPFSLLMAGHIAGDAARLVTGLEAQVAASGVNYCSLGPVLSAAAGEPNPLIAEVPNVLRATQRIFLSVMAATTRDGLNLKAVQQTARALTQAAEGDPEGTRPRRFTLSANVPANGPFFPSAYHEGPAGFSIAIEAADLAVDAFRKARTLDEASAGLTQRLVQHGGAVQRIAEGLAKAHGMRFYGLDISLAPYPDAARSIAGAMEHLGVGQFGGSGTLFASAFVTRILSQVPLQKCGFSGLMIPLLEDSLMASRYAEGTYTLDSLLLYSAVCGAGLDTIPVPGDATADQIASVYLDLCALSIALDKPLTVRLMPLAGKKAGDAVSFAFPYFAPTRVVKLPGAGSPQLFEKSAWVSALGQRGGSAS